uniref:Uncharacterized protein n=1 Tax=Tetranychus urticae TaxID=32264 RepID=T1KEU4_TETUR
MVNYAIELRGHNPALYTAATHWLGVSYFHLFLY